MNHVYYATSFRRSRKIKHESLVVHLNGYDNNIYIINDNAENETKIGLLQCVFEITIACYRIEKNIELRKSMFFNPK